MPVESEPYAVYSRKIIPLLVKKQAHGTEYTHIPSKVWNLLAE